MNVTLLRAGFNSRGAGLVFVMKLLAEICILFFIGFFERLIQLIDKNYRIEMEGFD